MVPFGTDSQLSSSIETVSALESLKHVSDAYDESLGCLRRIELEVIPLLLDEYHKTVGSSHFEVHQSVYRTLPRV